MARGSRWTAEQLGDYRKDKTRKKFKKEAKKQKYNSVACEGGLFPEIMGRSFPSKLERDVATGLCARLHAGEISDLRFQVSIDLTTAIPIPWCVDFTYEEDGVTWAHEAKGIETARYRLIKKLYAAYGPHPLRISVRGGKTGLRESTILPDFEKYAARSS